MQYTSAFLIIYALSFTFCFDELKHLNLNLCVVWWYIATMRMTGYV